MRIVLACCCVAMMSCSTAGLFTSAIQSPVVYDLDAINEPLSAEDAEQVACLPTSTTSLAASVKPVSSADRPSATWPVVMIDEDRGLRYDSMLDLVVKDTLVFVCLSGGGSRAARLAAHTLSTLERLYNERAAERGLTDPIPLIDLVDAYSTVSGGSLYAAWIAGQHRLDRADTRASRHERFGGLARNADVAWATRGLGTLVGMILFNPFNLFYPILAQWLTDVGYLHQLALAIDAKLQGLRFTHMPLVADLVGLFKMGALKPSPRFFFNSTCLDTGRRFVFTQSVVHRPGESQQPNVVRFDHHDDTLTLPSSPLEGAHTLEDIASDPAEFPLAYAAVASAAFPIGVQPLTLRRYHYARSSKEVYVSNQLLKISDGGIFDNSGLATAVDVARFAVLHPDSRVRRVAILMINADASEYQFDQLQDAPQRIGCGEQFPLDLTSPVPGFTDSYDALDMIHYHNKRNVEQAAWRRLVDLRREGSPQERLELFYLPVSLAQLSKRDKLPIPGGDALFQKVQGIATNYVISKGDDLLLDAAANLIVMAEQEWGWNFHDPSSPESENVKPDREYSLGEAFVRILIEAQSRRPPDGPRR